MQLDDLTKIVLTSALTIFGGVMIYVAGQILTRFFIDPYHEYRKIVGEIADALVFYANVYTNPGVGTQERMDEASNTLRQKGSLLRVRSLAIPWYGAFVTLRLVPSWESIMKASGALFGLSNNIHRGDPEQNARRRDEVIKALGLPSLL
jgi:hypothetical protein